jgi:hypothetical protein
LIVRRKLWAATAMSIDPLPLNFNTPGREIYSNK